MNTNNIDLLMFFGKTPEALPLYEAIADKILAELPDTKVKIQKSQIAFANKHGFAYISLPIRKRKDWPKVCIILTFGLSYKVYHLESKYPRSHIPTAGRIM